MRRSSTRSRRESGRRDDRGVASDRADRRIRRGRTDLDGHTVTVKQVKVETFAAEIQPAYNIATGLRSSSHDARSIAPREALLHGIPYHGTTQATRRNPRQRFSLDFAVFGAIHLPTIATGAQRSISAPFCVVSSDYEVRIAR
jgi:hypothetical protein